MTATGKVYLVGAGPGDPGLLTRKGQRCLEEADVVIYDYLVDVRLLDFTRPEAALVDAGKRGGDSTASQKTINQLMIEHASQGKVVTRLKGGDPVLFGR
ncbi:MAG: SAM-dependent methyltransferase, partial [Dehalococcoidia bacterium]